MNLHLKEIPSLPMATSDTLEMGQVNNSNRTRGYHLLKVYCVTQ